MPPTRLQKILSTAGIASRRTAETLIAQGRVTVNGVTVAELGSKADPDTDDIRVDARRVKPAARRRYFLMNKPKGFISTRLDPQKRPTVIDILLRHGIRDYVYPVGRLDYDSEGLLILTSDGELAAQLTHPSHEVGREYEVRVLGVPDEREVERIARGVVIDGRRTAPADIRITKTFETPSGRVETLLSIVIHEGRNRQVRKMCDAIGHPVARLRRVSIGPIADEGLRPGDFRELSPEEVAALRRVASAAPRPAPKAIRPAGPAKPKPSASRPAGPKAAASKPARAAVSPRGPRPRTGPGRTPTTSTRGGRPRRG